MDGKKEPNHPTKEEKKRVQSTQAGKDEAFASRVQSSADKNNPGAK